MTKKIQKVCQCCGKQFETYPAWERRSNGGVKYCSRECCDKGRSSNLIQICRTCGKQFKVYPSTTIKGGHNGGDSGVYCSKTCANTGISGEKSYRWKGGPPKYTCIVCGKEFTSYSNNPKYCSRSCLGEARRKRFLNRNLNPKAKPKIKVVCANCGKEFYTKPYKFQSNKTHYCSKTCKFDFEKLERHPAWNGGTSFEPYCPKFNKEFKLRVRAFFDYKCAECGMHEEENGKALGVHHVIYNKNTCCDGTIPLFVPLCTHCHSKTNSRRDHWQTHFTELINTKYGGKCYYTKEEWAELNAGPSPAAHLQRCTALPPAAARSR